MGIITFLAVGALSGWLAGKIMKGGGFGLLINILLGVVGAAIGGWVFSLLGLSAHSLIGQIVMSVIGAIILLYLIGLLKK